MSLIKEEGEREKWQLGRDKEIKKNLKRHNYLWRWRSTAPARTAAERPWEVSRISAGAPLKKTPRWKNTASWSPWPRCERWTRSGPRRTCEQPRILNLPRSRSTSRRPHRRRPPPHVPSLLIPPWTCESKLGIIRRRVVQLISPIRRKHWIGLKTYLCF